MHAQEQEMTEVLEGIEEGLQAQAEEQEVAQLSEEDAALLQDNGLEEEPEQQERTPQKSDNINVYRKRLNDERREKYRLLHEKAMLEQRLQEMEKSKQLNAEAANYLFAKNADERIETATKSLESAYEAGDGSAIAKATNELQKANIDKAEAEKWKFQQQVQQEAQQIPEYQQPEPMMANPLDLHRENIEEWEAQNGYWFNQNSPGYNPQAAYETGDFIVKMATQLVNEGQGYMLGSPEFLQAVNAKAAQALQNSQQRRQPQMKQVRTGGAPVRSGYQGSATPRQKPLPADLQSEMNKMIEGLQGAGYKPDPKVIRQKLEEDMRKRRQQAGFW